MEISREQIVTIIFTENEVSLLRDQLAAAMNEAENSKRYWRGVLGNFYEELERHTPLGR